jgi:hypothetical protein
MPSREYRWDGIGCAASTRQIAIIRQRVQSKALTNLVVQVLSLGVVLRTMALGAGAAVAPGVVIHVVLGGLFAFFLWKTRRPA